MPKNPGDEDSSRSRSSAPGFGEGAAHTLSNARRGRLHSVDPTRELLVPLERRFNTYWERTSPGADSYWDYSTGNFATYFPKRMKPSTLQRAVIDINAAVFSHRSILRNVLAKEVNQSLFGVYFGYGMKRINDTVRRIVDEGYMSYLREIEEGLYDRDEVLIEERLASSVHGLPLPPPLSEDVDRDSYEAIRFVAALPGLARYHGARLAGEVRSRAALPQPSMLLRGGPAAPRS